MTPLRRRAWKDLCYGVVSLIIAITSAYLELSWFALFLGFASGGSFIYALTGFRDDAAIEAERYFP